MNTKNLKLETKTVAYLCPEKIREYIEEEKYFTVGTDEFLLNHDMYTCIGTNLRIATVKEIHSMAELILKYSFDRQPTTKTIKELMIECIVECIINNCLVYENETRIVKE